MAQFNLGNVLAQAEQIKGLRNQNDPASPQNRLAAVQLQSAENQLDEQTKLRNTKELYQAYTTMAANPQAIPQIVDQLKARGVIGPEWQINKPLEQLAVDAGKQAQALAPLIGIKPQSPVNVAPGNALVDPSTGREIYARAPKSDVLSPEAEQQKMRLAAAGKPETNINNYAGDKAERIEMAKANVKWWENVADKADSAESLLQNVNQLDSIDIETGALEPAKVAIAAIAEGMGIDASGLANVTNAQSFTAISNRIVNDVLNQAKGPQTEGDAQRAKSTIASLGNTPKARKFISASLKATALRAIEMRDFIETRVDEGVPIAKARAEWRQFINQTPSLSSVVKDVDGLPVFFFQFKQHAKTVRPGITDAEIIDAWRQKHGG